MSSYLFGRMAQEDKTRKRVLTNTVPVPRGLIVDAASLARSSDANSEVAEKLAKQAEKPSTPPPDPSRSLVEGLLAIVPLEAITVWTIVGTQFSTTSTEPPAGSQAGNANDAITTISVTNERAVVVAALGCVLIAIVAYVSGKVSSGGRYDVKKWREISSNWQEVARMMVPPLAFFIWAYIQRPSLLRQAIEKPEPDVSWVIALVIGALLLIFAVALGMAKAPESDDEEQQPAEEGQPAVGAQQGAGGQPGAEAEPGVGG